MSIESRDLETRYFDVDGATLIRIECVRGDYEAYDGFFETLDVTWWLESPDDRRLVTQDEIVKLITGRDEIEPVGLANYFADANDLGSVISCNYTPFIDFEKSFGRNQRGMFPRIERGILCFTTSVNSGEPIVSESRFFDVTIDLQTRQIRKTMFWSGDHRELVITMETPNDG